MIDTEFKPKNPETLVGFDAILTEWNRINEKDIRFTDTYNGHVDLWVNEETTADNYGIYTIRLDGENLDLDNIYYYEPGVDDIFRAIDDNCYNSDTYTVYTDISLGDIEYYLIEELETNYQNWLDEQEDLS